MVELHQLLFQVFQGDFSCSGLLGQLANTQGTHVDSILTPLCKTVLDTTRKPMVTRNNSSLTTSLHTYVQRVNEDSREHSGRAAGSVLASLAWLYKQRQGAGRRPIVGSQKNVLLHHRLQMVAY